MNLRKIKLALTVDLLNSPNSESPLNSAKSVMEKYRNEAGDYQSTSITHRAKLSDYLEQSTHAIKFDNCTLDLNLIEDNRASKSLLQGFDLHENLF